MKFSALPKKRKAVLIALASLLVVDLIIWLTWRPLCENAMVNQLPDGEAQGILLKQGSALAPKLRRVLLDPQKPADAKHAAAQILSASADKAGLDFLVSQLTDPAFRGSAESTLSSAGAPAIDPVIRLLANVNVPATVVPSENELAQISAANVIAGVTPIEPRAIEPLLAHLGSTNDQVRLAMLNALSKAQLSPAQLSSGVLLCAADPEKAVRASAFSLITNASVRLEPKPEDVSEINRRLAGDSTIATNLLMLIQRDQLPIHSHAREVAALLSKLDSKSQLVALQLLEKAKQEVDVELLLPMLGIPGLWGDNSRDRDDVPLAAMRLIACHALLSKNDLEQISDRYIKNNSKLRAQVEALWSEKAGPLLTNDLLQAVETRVRWFPKESYLAGYLIWASGLEKATAANEKATAQTDYWSSRNRSSSASFTCSELVKEMSGTPFLSGANIMAARYTNAQGSAEISRSQPPGMVVQRPALFNPTEFFAPSNVAPMLLLILREGKIIAATYRGQIDIQSNGLLEAQLLISPSGILRVQGSKGGVGAGLSTDNSDWQVIGPVGAFLRSLPDRSAISLYDQNRMPNPPMYGTGCRNAVAELHGTSNLFPKDGWWKFQMEDISGTHDEIAIARLTPDSKGLQEYAQKIKRSVEPLLVSDSPIRRSVGLIALESYCGTIVEDADAETIWAKSLTSDSSPAVRAICAALLAGRRGEKAEKSIEEGLAAKDETVRFICRAAKDSRAGSRQSVPRVWLFSAKEQYDYNFVEKALDLPGGGKILTARPMVEPLPGNGPLTNSTSSSNPLRTNDNAVSRALPIETPSTATPSAHQERTATSYPQTSSSSTPSSDRFDPSNFQQRLIERLRQNLGMADASEWRAIEPRVQAVLEATRANSAVRFVLGGRAASTSRLSSFGTPDPTAVALSEAVNNGKSATQLKAACADFVAARAASRVALEKAKHELRQVLNTRQEAIAVTNGILQNPIFASSLTTLSTASATKMDEFKNSLETSSNAEWERIHALVQRVLAAGSETRLRPILRQPPHPDYAALQRAVESGASDKKLRAALDKLEQTYLEKIARLNEAEAELQKSLSTRQEAVALLWGLFP